MFNVVPEKRLSPNMWKLKEKADCLPLKDKLSENKLRWWPFPSLSRIVVVLLFDDAHEAKVVAC